MMRFLLAITLFFLLTGCGGRTAGGTLPDSDTEVIEDIDITIPSVIESEVNLSETSRDIPISLQDAMPPLPTISVEEAPQTPSL